MGAANTASVWLGGKPNFVWEAGWLDFYFYLHEPIAFYEQACSRTYETKRKGSAGSDDTASMIKGGGYIGARTRQPPTPQTIKRN